MYLLGLLCLLSAAVALPAPEQLHTNLLASSPAPISESDEKNKSSEEQMIPDPVPQEWKSDSAEKYEDKKDEDKVKPDDIKEVIDEANTSKDSKDSKESMESKQPTESIVPKESDEDKEPKESAEAEEPKEESSESDEYKKPGKESEESKEDKKDKKSEESKEDKLSKEDVNPIWIQVDVKKPFWSSFFPSLNLPHWPFPIKWPSFFGRSKYQYPDQWVPDHRMRVEPMRGDQLMSDPSEPIYIIKKSDFDFD